MVDPFYLLYYYNIGLCFTLFIHSGYLCSASSIPLLLRGAPDYSIDRPTV